MAKGTITIEDARLIHDFAQRMQPILRHNRYGKLLESAQTVGRISYCAMAEARANARAEQARQACFFIPPPGFFQDDPYTTEVAE